MICLLLGAGLALAANFAPSWVLSSCPGFVLVFGDGKERLAFGS